MKSIWVKIKASLFAALFLVLMPQHAFSDTIIRIDSADSTAYQKNDETGDDEIVLRGSVSISVESGSSKTTITASLVTYNRATDMLFAQGNVTLTQTGGSAGSQNISADSLLFNTATMEGVFDNGRVFQTQSDAINLPSGSTLVVSSEIFGRDSSSTIAFKNGELTFCDEEDPHWKIKASNVWLLPGGEFAFFNAVLFVGNIPVFYLPGFYYPKDELVFNPSIGYDERAGYHVQTTTYILGRKPLETDSSDGGSEVGAALFNFMRPSSLKEQEREGLVLHNLDEDYKGDTSKYVKVLADYYSNLGGMVGIEGVFKPKKFLTSLSASLQLGFSNTVFYDSASGTYMPYSSVGYTYFDHSNFMGLELPFRYSANLSLAFKKPFSFSLSMPLYSDIYFKDDFGNRSEYMDWIGFLMNGSDDSSSGTVGTFTWKATGSYSIPLPDTVKPFISQASISSVSSSITFNNAYNSSLVSENGDNWKSYTPERYFFYPSQINPVNATAKISGTLVQVNQGSERSKKKKQPAFPVDLEKPEELMTPEELQKAMATADKTNNSAEKSPEKSTENSTEKSSSKTEDPTAALADLPVLSLPQTPGKKDLGGLTYVLSYSAAPQLTSQLSYSTSSVTDKHTGLAGPENFDLSNLHSSYIQLKAPLNISSSLSYMGQFFSMDNSLAFNPVFQSHPNLNGYAEDSRTTMLKTDYTARKLDLTESNSISFKPFLFTETFKNTSIAWNTQLKMLRTEFLGDVDNPEWNYLFLDVTDKQSLSAHTLTANFSAVESENFSQSLSLSTTLPPQDDSYNANLSLTFPYVSVNFSAGISENTGADADINKWIVQPLQESISARFLKGNLRFSQSFNYNLEENYAESLKLSASWKTLQMSYSMAYTTDYTFNASSGWTANSDKKFLPTTVNLAYNTPSTKYRWWKNRITLTPTVGTSIVYDCLRPTNSYFKFVPTLDFNINDSLSLKFSSESRNGVIYRYVQDMVGSDFRIEGETNPFVDLWNSFAFWGNGHFIDPNQTLRKNSGFKLKSLSLTLNHNLHDWDLNSSVTVKPRLTTDSTGRKIYDFSPDFTFSVSWRPMSSLKTEIVDEYGTWILK